MSRTSYISVATQQPLESTQILLSQLHDLCVYTPSFCTYLYRNLKRLICSKSFLSLQTPTPSAPQTSRPPRPSQAHLSASHPVRVNSLTHGPLTSPPSLNLSLLRTSPLPNIYHHGQLLRQTQIRQLLRQRPNPRERQLDSRAQTRHRCAKQTSIRFVCAYTRTRSRSRRFLACTE